jgi:uncharacterized RDD family membrane protein YckC
MAGIVGVLHFYRQEVALAVVVLFNKRKRALHDFIAGTVVIQKKFAEQSPAPDSSPAAGSGTGEA